MATQVQKNKPDYDPSTNPDSYELVSQTSGKYQVEFREFPGGYNESHSTNEGTEYTRVLGCYWNQRNAFMMDLLGTCKANGDGTLSRTLPEFFPARSDFCCIDAKFLRWSGTPDFNVLDEPTLMTVSNLVPPFTPGTGAGAAGAGFAGDGFAWYSTTWRRPLYETLSDAQTAMAVASYPTFNTTPELARFVWRKPTYAGDTFPVGGSVFLYVNQPGSPSVGMPNAPQGLSGTPFMETLSKNNLYTEWTYTWYKAPVVPRTAIDACRGKVNSVLFDGFAAQTMLFEAVDIGDPYADVLGNLFQNVMYKFRAVKRANIQTTVPGSTLGHNLVWRAKTGKYEDYSLDGTMSLADGNRLYDQADFNSLFVATA